MQTKQTQNKSTSNEDSSLPSKHTKILDSENLEEASTLPASPDLKTDKTPVKIKSLKL